VSGMLISALSAPIYAASLAAVLLRRSGGFVTTPKGDAATRDSLITFRKHLLWGLVFGVPLAFSFFATHHHTSMRAWSFASLVVCLLPFAVWRWEAWRRPLPAVVREPVSLPRLQAVPDLPVDEPWPVEHERRKEHQVVRFDRRRAAHQRASDPVRELARGRHKDHVIVRFAPTHPAPTEAEPNLAWQMFGEVEA
jgi:hypothetical protein